MKYLQHIQWPICTLLFLSWSAFATHDGDYNYDCHNIDPPDCYDCNGNAVICDEVGSSISPGRANKNREVVDLNTFGEAAISFSRIYHSRTTAFTANYLDFGWRQTWQHSWNYELRDLTSKTHDQNNMILRQPNGHEFRFIPADSSGMIRVPPAFNGDRLYKWTGTNVGHTLVTSSGWEYDFKRTTSPRYRLEEVRNGQGLTWYLTYDGQGKLDRIENDFGRWLDIEYAVTNGVRCVASVSSSDGREVHYSYETWGYSVVSTSMVPEYITITNIINDGGSTYEQIVIITNFVPVVSTNEISNPVLTGVQYPDDSAAAYTYVGAEGPTNGRPLLATASDPRFHGSGARIKMVYNYDAIFDFGNGPYLVTGCAMEERNLDTDALVASVPHGPGYYPEVRQGDGSEITRKYNTNGLLIVVRDAEGRPQFFTHDQNEAGYVASITDGLSNTITYVRDYAGRILEETDPLGHTNYMSYNDAGYITNRIDKLGRITTYTRDTNNLLTRADYPNGSFEEWSYNQYGQVLAHTQRNGGTNMFAYYDGVESGGMLGDLKSRTDAEGNTTTYTWDASGQLVSMIDSLSNTTWFTYNWRGLLTDQTNANLSVVRYQYDAFGNRTNLIDALSAETSYTYDEFNRVVTIQDALNRTTSYEYGHTPGGCGGCAGSGATISRITDPSGRVTENYYDRSEKMTNQVIGAGTADASATHWTYDITGRRQTQTDDNGNLHVWVYDAVGRVIAETNATGATTAYAHDPVGNITNRIDGAGEQTFWHYDNMNRLIAQGSGDLRYEYEYDLTGNRTAMHTRVNGSITETTAYSYDLNNRLIEKIDPAGFSLNYRYDAVDNRTNLVVARTGGGEVLNQVYRYDSLYNVMEIEANGRSSFFSYDGMGRRTNAVWPNGTTATYTYDDAHQLLSLVHANGLGSPLASFTYGYDLVGNRTNMITLEGENRYAYDARNWLIEAEYPDDLKEAFAYDGVGNRLSLTETTNGTPMDVTAYTYGTANRLFSSTSAAETNEYFYDNAGRQTNHLVNGAGRTFAYNFRSQMIGLVDVNESEFAYGFDGDANRISQSLNDCLSARYVYDGPNVVLDINATGHVAEAYVHFPGIDQPIERISFINDEPRQRQVYHQDGLGSVAALTDDGENIVKSYTYRAFGRIRSETGLGLNRYTYTARESIGDTRDLMYYRYRVLSTRAGRFTSFDPLSFVDGANVYFYVLNNPLNIKDPSGLSAAAGVARIITQPVTPGPGGKDTSDGISGLSKAYLARECMRLKNECDRCSLFEETTNGKKCSKEDCKKICDAKNKICTALSKWN